MCLLHSTHFIKTAIWKLSYSVAALCIRLWQPQTCLLVLQSQHMNSGIPCKMCLPSFLLCQALCLLGLGARLITGTGQSRWASKQALCKIQTHYMYFQVLRHMATQIKSVGSTPWTQSESLISSTPRLFLVQHTCCKALHSLLKNVEVFNKTIEPR